MSTTRGVRTLVGAALASSIILLGGCSSSGTTSGSTGGGNPLAGGNSTHSAAGTTGGSSGGSSSSDSSGTTGGSSGALGGSDPGCQAAMSAAENAMSGINLSDPNGAKNALKSLADKMHTAASQSKNPAAAAAINKVGDDYANFANTLGSGTPDTSALQTDATAMGTACAGG